MINSEILFQSNNSVKRESTSATPKFANKFDDVDIKNPFTCALPKYTRFQNRDKRFPIKP